MKVRIPDKKTPGYLQRLQKAQLYIHADGVDKMELMVEWLIDYVDEKDPREAIMNASEDEISELMNAINASGVPDPKAPENSEDG